MRASDISNVRHDFLRVHFASSGVLRLRSRIPTLFIRWSCLYMSCGDSILNKWPKAVYNSTLDPSKARSPPAGRTGIPSRQRDAVAFAAVLPLASWPLIVQLVAPCARWSCCALARRSSGFGEIDGDGICRQLSSTLDGGLCELVYVTELSFVAIVQLRGSSDPKLWGSRDETVLLWWTLNFQSLRLFNRMGRLQFILHLIILRLRKAARKGPK